MQGSGKSTVAKVFEGGGWKVLNRDSIGGRLPDLIPHMVRILKSGEGVVLDNTFVNREARAPFIKAAKEAGAEVVCSVMQATIEECQWAVCRRMMEKYGRLLMPEDFKNLKKDPSVFPPIVQYTFRNNYEEPAIDEGFDHIDSWPFSREVPWDFEGKALILDYDGTLRVTKSGAKWPTNPDDVEIMENRAEVLRRYQDEGYLLLGATNQSGVSKDNSSLDVCQKCFDRTNELLGLDIEVSFCPHRAGVPQCYCRKPMPGMGVEMVFKHKLDPKKCIMVGDAKTDKTFADRNGFQFQYADKFFASSATDRSDRTVSV